MNNFQSLHNGKVFLWVNNNNNQSQSRNNYLEEDNFYCCTCHTNLASDLGGSPALVAIGGDSCSRGPLYGRKSHSQLRRGESFYAWSPMRVFFAYLTFYKSGDLKNCSCPNTNLPPSVWLSATNIYLPTEATVLWRSVCQPGPRPVKKINSIYQLHYTCIENSDWLKFFEQPIRMLKGEHCINLLWDFLYRIRSKWSLLSNPWQYLTVHCRIHKERAWLRIDK